MNTTEMKRTMKDMNSAGYTHRQIADSLNRRGYTTRKGSSISGIYVCQALLKMGIRKNKKRRKASSVKKTDSNSSVMSLILKSQELNKQQKLQILNVLL